MGVPMWAVHPQDGAHMEIRVQLIGAGFLPLLCRSRVSSSDHQAQGQVSLLSQWSYQPQYIILSCWKIRNWAGMPMSWFKQSSVYTHTEQHLFLYLDVKQWLRFISYLIIKMLCNTACLSVCFIHQITIQENLNNNGSKFSFMSEF